MKLHATILPIHSPLRALPLILTALVASACPEPRPVGEEADAAASESGHPSTVDAQSPDLADCATLCAAMQPSQLCDRNRNTCVDCIEDADCPKHPPGTQYCEKGVC